MYALVGGFFLGESVSLVQDSKTPDDITRTQNKELRLGQESYCLMLLMLAYRSIVYQSFLIPLSVGWLAGSWFSILISERAVTLKDFFVCFIA